MWRGCAQRLYQGVKTWLQDKLGAVFSWVQDKVRAVEATFAWLYNEVVGNSWIPDMVEEVGQHMNKLDKLMVDPTVKATKKTEEAFRDLAREVSGILDRLFPKVAALKAMKDDISSIEAGVKAGVISADVGEEARSRCETCVHFFREVAARVYVHLESMTLIYCGKKLTADRLHPTAAFTAGPAVHQEHPRPLDRRRRRIRDLIGQPVAVLICKVIAFIVS